MSLENSGVYFTELKLQNVRCFGSEAVLKLCNDEGKWTRWNVILGDNGTGKTTLLQCLAGMEQIAGYDNINRQYEWNAIALGNSRFSFNKSDDFISDSVGNFKHKLEAKIKASIYNAYFVSTPLNLEFSQSPKGNFVDSSKISKNLVFSHLFILGYGANRRISFQILSEKETNPDNSSTLFDDDAKLINTEEWLYQMDYAANYAENNNTVSESYIKLRRNQIITLLEDILPDIKKIEFKLKDDPSNPRPVMRFKTLYGWVGIHELSYGYKTMVAWVVDVAARMFRQYPNEPNPLAMPVVILVDEIDLHLHPKWQRQIFDFLGKRFPRAQFIVTAHSPLIVQSAPKDANIIVLKKEKEGDEYVVRIDNDVESVRNWRIDQIMTSDLFGLESSRNPEVEAQMKERTILMQKDTLKPNEKQRLDELNEISYSLPTADNFTDIKAMELIRKAADFLKNKNTRDDTVEK